MTIDSIDLQILSPTTRLRPHAIQRATMHSISRQGGMYEKSIMCWN